MVDSMHSNSDSAPAVLHSDVNLIKSLAEPVLSDRSLKTSAHIPARKRFKQEIGHSAKSRPAAFSDEEKLHEIFPERKAHYLEDPNKTQRGGHRSPSENTRSRVVLGKSRINRNRILFGISPGLNLKSETLQKDSNAVHSSIPTGPIPEQHDCECPAPDNLLANVNAIEGKRICREQLDTQTTTCDDQSLYPAEVIEFVKASLDFQCHHEPADDSQAVHLPLNPESHSIAMQSEFHPLQEDPGLSVCSLQDIESAPIHGPFVSGSNCDIIASETHLVQKAPGLEGNDLKHEETVLACPMRGIEITSLKTTSQDIFCPELSSSDKASRKTRIPSVCLMPCKCERCFFGAESSLLNELFFKRRWQSDCNNAAFWGKRHWNSKNGFQSQNSKRAPSQSMEIDHGRAQGETFESFSRHRPFHSRRAPFLKSFIWGSDNERRVSDSWGSAQQTEWKLADVPWANLTSKELDSIENNSGSPENSNSTAPSLGTEASINSQIPVKRLLSAAEKEAILSKTKFQMRAPVLTSTAIPRLDENHRPRRPLVRPVYSTPSTRVNLRPARLVAYRSDSKLPKLDSVDVEDESSPSVNDEIPTVSEELVGAASFTEGEITEEEAGSNFLYIRYAKGRIGVQLLSFPSSSSSTTNKGLYCDLVFPRNKTRDLLPLPLSGGAEMLNDQTEFKLPFSMAQGRLSEIELDGLRKTGTFVNNPPPFFIINRNICLPTTILPEYAGGDEILDCECPVEIAPGCGSCCINRLTHVECEPDQCKLGDRCTNQRFQKRQWAKLTVEYMGEKGWGLVLAQDVRQGDLMIEYVGELVDFQTCKDRCRNEYRAEKHFYLLSLYNNIIIDATRRGNIGRFCNHSCEPSCETQKWSVRGSPRIGIFSLRDLPKGTEVTMDYNFERIGLAMTKCLCGAESCRGFLGASKTKKKKEQICFDFDYDVARDDPPILDSEEQVSQLSEYLNRDRLPDFFLSMIAEIGSNSAEPALLLRNVVRVHSAFMDRLEYNPGDS